MNPIKNPGRSTACLRDAIRFVVASAIEPVVLAPGGLNAAWPHRAKDLVFLVAFASAFSPVVSVKNTANIPTLDGTAEDHAEQRINTRGQSDPRHLCT